MIYQLRRDFIRICALCFLGVFVVLFASILLITTLQTNHSLDTLADIVSENNGSFPSFGDMGHGQGKPGMPNGINTESPFTTRYFTVQFDEASRIVLVDTHAVASVSETEAAALAAQVLEKGKTRGWSGEFRYKLYETDRGQALVFVSGMNARQNNRQFLMASVLVFAAGSVAILFLIIWLSGRAVKPAAESYEKQKQFITDANHELKTPLTLIRTNLDIMEGEIGENEWLSDIREEARIMTGLVNQLVMLARMDEEETRLERESFCLSDAVLDTLSTFVPHIRQSEKGFAQSIAENIRYNGNEASIRQLVSILMDNAVKYCDPGGSIRVTLSQERRPVLTVDNACANLSDIQLDKLFDRFYRADKARTYGGGYGIGLSIARAIVQKHGGKIAAQALDPVTIRFRVEL